MYMLRLNKGDLGVSWTDKTIHRLLTAALIVSIKFWDDIHITDKAFAQIAGIDIRELIRLESFFLRAIDFRLFLELAEYQKFCSDFFLNDDKVAL